MMKLKLEAALDYLLVLVTIWGSCVVDQSNASKLLKVLKFLQNHTLLSIFMDFLDLGSWDGGQLMKEAVKSKLDYILHGLQGNLLQWKLHVLL